MFKNFLILWVLSAGTLLQASDQNLLRNIELKNDAQNPSLINEWQVKSEQLVKSDEIVAFQGLADAMFFFKGEGKAQIRQKDIKIEPDTWYVMSVWYKNLLKNDNQTPYGLYLGAANPGGNDWDSFSYKCFGGSGKWVNVRAFFNSGKRTNMDFLAMLFGDAQWELGRLVLRKLKDSDFYSKFVVDGDFENGAIGSLPVEFRKSGKLSLFPVIKENSGFLSGEKNMAAEVSPEHPLFIVGPDIIASKNDLVKVSVWAKADKPGATLSLAFWEDKFLKESGAALSTKWRKFELMTKMPNSGKYFNEGPRRLRFRIKGEAADSNTIRFDNVEIKTLPPEALAQKKTGNNLLIMNSSFEAGFAGWEWMCFEPVNDHNEGGNISIDMTTAAEGNCSLKIKMPKSDSKVPRHCLRLKSACFEAAALEPFTVSFWAKSDQEQAKCKVRMFYGNGGNLYLTKEWKRYQTKIVATKDKQGKNTLNLEFLLNGGTYWIDGVQVEKGDKMTAYEPDGKLEIGGVFPDKVYPFYVSGKRVEAEVYTCSRYGNDKNYNISWEVSDYLGEVVAQYSGKVTIPAKTTIKQAMPLFSGLKGHFIVKFKLEDPETGTVAESPLVYGIFPEPKNVDPAQSWFGILPGSLGCARRGNPATFVALKGGSYDRQMKIFKLCGFNWIRTFAAGNWSNTESEKGKFNWKFDKPIQTILDNNLKVYMTIGGYKDFPKWSNSEKSFEHKVKYDAKYYPKIEDWKNYAIAFAKHFKGKVDVATIMSEPQYSVDEYLELIKTLRPALKEVAPEMRIALPGFPCQALPWDDKDDTWIGRLMKKGLYDYFDIYHGHFYLAGNASTLARVRKEPFESAINGKYGTKVEELLKQVKYFRKTYGDKPIWDTESGTIFTASVPWMEIPPEHLTFDWYTPEVSAARMVRWGIVRMAAGIKRHMYFMFNLPFMHNYHCLDIVNYNMSPRVGLPALSQFARRLDVTKFKHQLKVGNDTWVYVFEDGDNTIAVYWNYSLECKKRAKVILPLNREDILVEDMMGNQVNIENKDANVILPVACSPTYVVSSKLNSGQMLGIFKKAKVFGGVACKLRVAPGNINGKVAVVAGVVNLSSDSLEKVDFKLDLPAGWSADAGNISFQRIDVLQTMTAGLPLTSLCNSPHKRIRISGVINEKPYLADSKELFLAAFSEARMPVKVDGQIEENEYGKEAVLVLDQSFQLIEKVWADGRKPVLKSWLEGKKPVSCRMWAKWAPESIFIGFKIKDDDVINEKPIGRLFAGDSVEVYLDFSPEKNMFSDNYEDHQIKLVFAPANGNYPARFQAEAMGRKIDKFKYIPFDDIKVKSLKTVDGYNIEVKIPLKNITMNSERLLGFNAQLIGASKTSKMKYALMWNGKVSWNNPRAFGFAILKPAE
jgi:cellulose/xylan binding protein with CBM9 domain